MTLRIVPIEVSEEQVLVTSMVVSTEFLNKIEPVLEVRFFDSPYAKLVATWVLEFHKATKKAPGANISQIYQRKCPDLTEEDGEMVGKFLTSISEKHSQQESFNVQYAYDNAVRWLKLQSAKRLLEKLSSAVSEGNTLNTEKIIGDYRRIKTMSSVGVDVTKNACALFDAINSQDELLFEFSGDLGKVIGPVNRGAFLAFGAPPKRGKSWMLYHTAQRAMQSGLKVVFVSLEMTEKQSLRRLWQMICGAPIRTGSYVRSLFVEGDDGWRIEASSRKYRGLDEWTKQEIEEAQRKAIVNSRGGQIKLFTFPTRSFSVADLLVLVENLENYDNWIPDVIVVDYADIMKSGSQDKDERNKLNEIWLALRGLAQLRHIAVVSASQSGRETLKGKDNQASDVSEDIRKIAHVSGFATLNQTSEEKAVGIMRVSCDIRRDGKTIDDCAVVLQCLDLGVAHLQSKLSRKIEGQERGKPFLVSEQFRSYFERGNKE